MFKKSWREWKYLGLLLFIFCLAVQVIWLLAFYPGAMTNDSIYLWKQSALGFGYINVQPYLYTYLLHLLRLIWDSPAVITIPQIAISAGLAAYFSVYLLKQKANKWLVAAGYLAYTFSIPIMITNSIVHRDAINAQVILLLAIVLTHIFFSEKKEITTWQAVAFGALLALSASMRYDSIVYILGVPIIIYIYKLLPKKNLTTILVSGITLYLFVQIPLSMLLEVKEGRFLQVENMETRIISGIYKQKPKSLSDEDLKLMQELAPLSTWGRYDPTDDITYWDGYKTVKFWNKDFKARWDTFFWEKAKKNPDIIASDRFYMTLGLLRGEKINGPGIVKNEIDMEQRDVLGHRIRARLGRLFSWSYTNTVARFFIWSPFYLIVSVAGLILSVIYKKKYLTVYCLIGLIGFLAILPGVTSGQFRYMLPIYYTSFYVPALFTIQTKPLK